MVLEITEDSRMVDTTSQQPKAAHGSFFLVACAGFASMVGMRICDALLPDLAESFQVSTGVAAGSISLFVIAYGLLQLVYGPLGDRYGKQRVISFAVSAAKGPRLVSLTMTKRWRRGGISKSTPYPVTIRAMA